jgi:hypothetical protein
MKKYILRYEYITGTNIELEFTTPFELGTALEKALGDRYVIQRSIWIGTEEK